MKKFTLLCITLCCLGIFSAGAQCFTLHLTSNSSFCTSGSIIAIDSGGIVPYTYSWSPGGQTTSSITGLSTGTYSVTVTDAAGCSQTSSAIVLPGSVSYSASGYPSTIVAGDSAGLSATCNAPATYSWAPPISVTYPDSSSSYARPAVTTVYTVTITTSCGSFIDSVLVNVNCFNVALTSTSSFCSSGTATATPSGGTPPYTYTWFPSVGTTSTVTGLSAGTYSAVVYDATGCFSTDSVVVSAINLSYSATGNPTSITRGDSSLLTASCNEPATFSWAPSASVTYPDSSSSYAHPSATTNYTLTITTACSTFTDNVLITVNCFTINLTSTSSFCTSSSITATPSGGTPPYTYSWAPGGQTTSTITGLTTGIYSVTVFDATGCSGSASTIIHSDTLAITAYGNPSTIAAGDSTLLWSTPNDSATYSWAPASSVTHPDSSSSYAHPAVTTNYTLTVTTSCGTFIEDVLITVNCFSVGITSTSSYCASGTVSATPSGGTSPYTYSWSPGGQTTSSITGLNTGGYTVTVTDNTGCSVTAYTYVSGDSVVYSASANPTTITSGDSTLLSASSNVPATYSWAPAGSVTHPDSANTYAHPTVTTEYIVTITTSCGTFTDSVLIHVNCFSLGMSSTPSCSGSSSYDGTASVTASGGTPPYTYLWSPGGGTTSAISALNAGNYSVTVTDHTGCSSTGSVSVSSASESFSISGNPTTIIAGDSTLLTVTSNLAATYSWSPSASVTHPDSAITYAHPAVTTEYIVTITTSCGTYTDSVLIHVNCFKVSLTSTSSFCASGTVTATPSGGTSPYTYSWAPGGQTTSTITGVNAGAYSVTVRDATGCSATAVIVVSGDSVTYSASGNPGTINSGDSTLLSASSNVPATYSWAPAGSVTHPDSASTYAHPTVTTEYIVTITTSCGTFTDSVLIHVNCFSLGMSSTPSCSGSSSYDGTASVTASGGTPPYTYLWSPGGGTTSTISALNAGNYSVTVTDHTGCSSTGSVSVSSASESFSVSGNPTTIIAGDSTLLTATSNLAATYSWAPSASVTYPDSSRTYANPATYTIYTVTITTACGTYTDAVAITVNCFPVSMSSTPSCNSSYDGSATVSPSGGTPPYTYLWSPGGLTTSTITGLYIGSYSVVVQDATGCSASGTVSISSATESYSISGNPTTLVTGDSTLLTVYSNLASTYAWAPSGSVTYPDSFRTYATPTVTTEYTVTINTSCGTFTDSVLITVDCFSLVTTSTSSYCSSGTVTATASSGTAPYTYLWAPGGQTTSTVTGLGGGTYSVTVHDASGCSVTSSAVVSAVVVTYSASGNPLYINAGDSTLLTATCNEPATYSWAPPLTVTNPDSASTYANPTGTAEYTVTITTACNTFVDSVLIHIQCFPLTMSSTPNYNCSSSYDGSATVTTSGGTPPYTYLWTPGGQTNATATGLYAGNYSVTVTDATGCSATNAVSVSSASVSLTVSEFPPVISLGDSSSLLASIHGSAIYSWAPATGLSCTTCANPWASPTVTTIYTVTVTDTCAGVLTGYDTVVVSNCTNNYVQPICIVTVDSGNNCEVIWGRSSSPPAGGYGAFYIYKDSTRGFELTHSQPLNYLSDYYDPFANAGAGPVSYALATLDSCGESALSSPATTIYLTTTAGVNVYILNWTAYIGFTPTEYRILRGPNIGSMVQIDSVASSVLTYHDTLPPAGSIYMIEAVNPSGTCVPTTHRPFRPSAELSGSFSNGFNTRLLGVQPINNSITNLNIYPNPSNGMVTIQWSAVSGLWSDVQIGIINELGQIVYSQNIPAAKGTLGTGGTYTEQLNLSNLASGIYTLRVQSNSSITVKKLVIIQR